MKRVMLTCKLVPKSAGLQTKGYHLTDLFGAYQWRARHWVLLHIKSGAAITARVRSLSDAQVLAEAITINFRDVFDTRSRRVAEARLAALTLDRLAAFRRLVPAVRRVA